MNEEKKVIYDAENEEIDVVDNEDSRPELNQTDNIVYDAETEQTSEHIPETEDEYEIDENQKTVFENGLEGGQFIRMHNCPMCMVGKKSISELYMKKRFSKKKKVVGYASICANCGFTSFYTTSINDLLSLFRGKVSM